MLKRKVFRATVTLAQTILFRSSCNLLGTVYRQQPQLLIHNIDIWLTSNARLLSIRARFTNHNTTSSELIGRTLYLIENLNQNNARPLDSSMAEMAVQGLLEFWPCKSVNNPNFGLPIKFNFQQIIQGNNLTFSVVLQILYYTLVLFQCCGLQGTGC